MSQPSTLTTARRGLSLPGLKGVDLLTFAHTYKHTITLTTKISAHKLRKLYVIFTCNLVWHKATFSTHWWDLSWRYSQQSVWLACKLVLTFAVLIKILNSICKLNVVWTFANTYCEQHPSRTGEERKRTTSKLDVRLIIFLPSTSDIFKEMFNEIAIEWINMVRLFVFCNISITKYKEGDHRVVEVNVLDYNIIAREFELQLRYYVHFRTNTLRKSLNPLISQAIG